MLCKMCLSPVAAIIHRSLPGRARQLLSMLYYKHADFIHESELTFHRLTCLIATTYMLKKKSIFRESLQNIHVTVTPGAESEEEEKERRFLDIVRRGVWPHAATEDPSTSRCKTFT